MTTIGYGVRAEFELRFIYDLLRPIPPAQRDIILSILGKMRELRMLRHEPTFDLDILQRELVAQTEEPPLPSPPALSSPPTLREANERRIEEVLTQTHWNIDGAARLLGISRRTLYREIDRLGLVRPGTKRYTKNTHTKEVLS